MTESQKIRVKTRIAQERKMLGRELTNSEQNKVKDEIVTEISKEVSQVATKARALKKKDKLKPSDETFSWTAKNHSRGIR